MIDKKDTTNKDQFRELLQDSKLTASDNLRYRIMHQIEAEKALAPKTIKSEKPIIKSLLSIACVMYAIIMAIGLATYLAGGASTLLSTEFILSIVGIASMAAVFALVTILDERRYKS